MTQQDFILWEAASKDTIDFKMIYVDIMGDIVGGLYLSQVVYWHLPNSKGGTKLRVERDGKLWIAKADGEWFAETRLTAKQARRSREMATEKGYMESKIYKFAGAPKCHVRIKFKALMAEINRLLLDKIDLPSEANGLDPQDESIRPQGHSSFTENTTETTTEKESPLSVTPPLFESRESAADKPKKPRDEIAWNDFAHFCSIWNEKTKQDYSQEKPGLFFAARKKYSQEKLVRAMINYANSDWHMKNRAWNLNAFLAKDVFRYLPTVDTLDNSKTAAELLDNLPAKLAVYATLLEPTGEYGGAYIFTAKQPMSASFVEEEFKREGLTVKIVKQKVGKDG